MRCSPILLLSAALLAGCNQGGAPSAPTAANASAEAVPAAAPTASVAAPIGIKPGKWENRYEVLDVKADGLPPQTLAAMKAQPHSVTTCVTPEQAKTGVRELLRGDGKAKCSFDKYEFGGGRIATELSCDMPGGKTVTRSTGTYTDTSYEAVGEGTISGPMSMTMKTKNSGKWLGACTGDEAGR